MKRSRAQKLFAIAVCLGGSACGPGNTGRTLISDSLAEAVPWVNGRPPVRDSAGQVVIPDEPEYPDIATGMEDPGPLRKPGCGVTKGLEFSSVFFLDFEADDSYPNAVGVAEAWAGHDDDSEGSFRTPGEINWYPGLINRHGAPWGMPADRVEGAPTCEGKNHWALHYRGGRFNLFGGGVGHPLALLDPCPEAQGKDNPDALLCPPKPEEGAETDAAGIPVQGRGGKPYAQPHNYWNLSGFDGVAFWARRGPEGQGLLTVILTEKHTSDDLNRENEVFCRRLVKCRTGCINRQPCSPVDPKSDDSLHRCFDPAEGPFPVGLDEALADEIYPRCGPSACTFPATYEDRDYAGKECQPFTFDSHYSGEFCFDKGDPAPPDTGERCGDGFARTVNLSTEWKFFKIPFSELRQQGYGKIAPFMDLTTVSNMIFVVQQGWADFYLDNVTFYREAD